MVSLFLMNHDILGFWGKVIFGDHMILSLSEKMEAPFFEPEKRAVIF